MPAVTASAFMNAKYDEGHPPIDHYYEYAASVQRIADLKGF